MVFAHWQLGQEVRLMPIHMGYWGDIPIIREGIRPMVRKFIVIH